MRRWIIECWKVSAKTTSFFGTWGNGCKNAPSLSSIASLIKAGHSYNAFLATRRISASINKRMATPELIIKIRSHSRPPRRLRDVWKARMGDTHVYLGINQIILMFPCDCGWTSFSFNSETVLLCQMCNAIAQGFMQPWIPALPPPTAPATPSKDKSDKPDKAKGRQSGKGGTKGGPSKGSLQTVAVDPEATPDLKQALEVRRRWKYKWHLQRKKLFWEQSTFPRFFFSILYKTVAPTLNVPYVLRVFVFSVFRC